MKDVIIFFLLTALILAAESNTMKIIWAAGIVCMGLYWMREADRKEKRTGTR